MHKLIVFVLACLVSLPAPAAKPHITPKVATLESLRQDYVGHWFVVENTDADWHIAEPYPGGGGYYPVDAIKDKLKSQAFQLVWLSEHPRDGPRTFSPNAVGETSSNANREIYLDMFFKDTKNNRFLAIWDSPELLERSTGKDLSRNGLRMTTSIEQHADKVPSLLPGLIGRFLYADLDSHIYQESTSLEDLVEENSDKRVKKYDDDAYCCMKPLPILKAQYVEPQDAVVLKLGLPNGGAILTIMPYVDNEQIPLIARIRGTLYNSIPPELSVIDLRALRHNSILTGMSRVAVEMEMGFPENENDYGNGGIQLIYYHGKRLIYLNSSDKVTNTQSLDF